LDKGVKMPIFTVRTTVGRERTAVDAIDAKLKNNHMGIQAILNPAEIKGYVFIEGSNEEEIKDALHGVPHVRGIIPKEVAIDDLKNFFIEKSVEMKFKECDIVEIVGGPFKKSKAKIIRLDEAKREARIELIDAAVPIPITIKMELLKVSR